MNYKTDEVDRFLDPNKFKYWLKDNNRASAVKEQIPTEKPDPGLIDESYKHLKSANALHVFPAKQKTFQSMRPR